MVQNIPGKSFPQQFENRIFCWKLKWYKTFREKFPQKIEKSSSVLLPFQFWPIKWRENT